MSGVCLGDVTLVHVEEWDQVACQVDAWDCHEEVLGTQALLLGGPELPLVNFGVVSEAKEGQDAAPTEVSPRVLPLETNICPLFETKLLICFLLLRRREHCFKEIFQGIFMTCIILIKVCNELIRELLVSFVLKCRLRGSEWRGLGHCTYFEPG